MLQLKRLKHQFLHGGQPSGSAEHLHRLGQLGGGGEGGGDADIAVLRVLMVGVRGARSGENHSGLLAQLNNSFGAAGHGHIGDEVAPLGLDPGARPGGAHLLLQGGQHRVELGPEEGSVLVHLGLDAGGILKEAHMAQHVQLIPADGLGVQLFGDEVHIVPGGGEEGHPRPRKGDFRGGAEHVDHVGAARLLHSSRILSRGVSS